MRTFVFGELGGRARQLETGESKFLKHQQEKLERVFGCLEEFQKLIEFPFIISLVLRDTVGGVALCLKIPAYRVYIVIHYVGGPIEEYDGVVRHLPRNACQVVGM